VQHAFQFWTHKRSALASQQIRPAAPAAGDRRILGPTIAGWPDIIRDGAAAQH